MELSQSAHWRPRRLGRGRLRQHDRLHQGHGHSGRGEHLPPEIEEILMKHPDVLDAQVIDEKCNEEEFPMTITGKVREIEIREAAAKILAERA